MSDKHRHLLGLAIKYLIKVNRSLQDKKVDRYITKLQQAHKKMGSQEQIEELSVLQYDLHCGLKELYALLRTANLLDKSNKIKNSKYLANRKVVYFSPAGNRCVVNKIVFDTQHKQKILQLIICAKERL